MDLSIVIPVFQERAKIARDVQAAAAFLQSARLAGEIIVVDDGSRDGTADIARRTGVIAPVKLNVIHYDQNRGKGFAVRTGILASQGKCVMFADSGLCVPYQNARRGLNMIETGVCDIAHGSRKLPQSRIVQAQPWPRRLTARIFRALAVHWLGVPSFLTDTQCGFKIYRGHMARELYGEAGLNGFLFDIEIILRALRKGYRIREFPVEWTCDRDSRLSLTRSPLQVWREMLNLKQAFKSR